jgi:hypothetical protein
VATHHVLVPWTATKGVTIVAAENIDIANFFKVGSHIAKKSLAAKTTFGSWHRRN